MKTTLFSVVLLLLLYGRTACQSIEVTVTHTFDDNIMNIGEFKIMDENRSSDIIDWRAPGSAILPAAPLYWVFTRASEDVVDRAEVASTVFKHRSWNKVYHQHFLELSFDGMESQELIADYWSTSHTTIFNNLEEHSDHGALEFLDPWYVAADGSQPNDYVSKASPYLPIGGYNDAIGGGVFLQMPITEGSPFYKARFNYLLGASAQPITTPRPLTKGDYILQGVFTRNKSKVNVQTEHNSTFWNPSWGQGWIPNQARYANLRFLDDNSSVFGFYKKHLTSITQEIAPTEGNNQRKVAIETKSGGYRHHLVYESGSKIFYTSSSDSGASYNPEVLISDYYHDCSRPSIAVRNEYQYPTLVPAGIYATYVDATASALLIRWTSLDCRPETWVTLDSIPLATWQTCHPVIAAASWEADNFVFAVWNDNDTLRYSIYNGTVPLVAERLTGDFRFMQITTGFTFRDVPIAWAYTLLGNRVITPKYPSIVTDIPNGVEPSFALSWMMEGSRQQVFYKGFLLDDIFSGYRVIDTAAYIVSDNSNRPVYGSRPSVAAWINPFVTYQYRASYAPPSTAVTWPVTVMSRQYYQVPSVINQRTPLNAGNIGYDYIAVQRGAGAVAKAYGWGRQVTSIAIPSCIIGYPNPVLSAHNRNISLAANSFTLQSRSILSSKIPYRLPQNCMAIQQTSGLEPSLAPTLGPFEVYSYYLNDPWTAQSQNIAGAPFIWTVEQTTAGLSKTPTENEDTRTRLLQFSVNDSAYAYYGATQPAIIIGDTVRNALTWDYASDTTDAFDWEYIRHLIKTESFTVPENSRIEYAADVFAKDVEDFGDTLLVVLELRRAIDDVVVKSIPVDLRSYELDSAIYVLERVDLSDLAGQTVYFNVNASRSELSVRYGLNVIQYYDSASVEKDPSPAVPDRQAFYLDQNYPNPFNPSTTIPFFISEPGNIRLSVHNYLGVEIGVLHEGFTSTGHHQITFSTSGLPSGTYIYRLSNGQCSVSKRMTLLK